VAQPIARSGHFLESPGAYVYRRRLALCRQASYPSGLRCCVVFKNFRHFLEHMGSRGCEFPHQFQKAKTEIMASSAERHSSDSDPGLVNDPPFINKAAFYAFALTFWNASLATC
jgi:hypothetical protein